jgi:enoyl-[acyl-carrier protein] reductase II
MGTRFMSSMESPLHANYKQEIADSPVTIRVYTGQPGACMRVIRNAFSERVVSGEIDPNGNPYAGPALELFQNGKLDVAMAGVGESASLVHQIKPVNQIIDETVREFWAEVERLAGLLKPARVPVDA